ncbi:unnamed protein product [Cylindrotheca closterium]|uniref:CDAN1-interacting nuclease 1 n=1 Tax=Cylindrotheca closterium TaxID=2856 RepID=A0AAD2CF70_9STRA|nr:unnamed protein product [Cylindrotheca closterium]
MPADSNANETSKSRKNRQRRRGSRKRARSQDQTTAESSNGSHPPQSAVDSIEKDDRKPIQHDRKPKSIVTGTHMKPPGQNQKYRRPRRKNKPRKGGCNSHHNIDASRGIENGDIHDDKSCAQRVNQGQNQNQNSNKAKHVDIDMNDDDLQVLCWSSPSDFVPVQSEEAMVKVMLPRGKRERGMMRNYLFRLKEIKQALKSAHGMTLKQALSLRRLHIKNFNPTMTMSGLGLGEDEDILKSANIFEECVQEFLDQNAVQYWTEKEQRERAKEYGMEGPRGTPDFLLRGQVMLRKVRGNGDTILEERKINWVECKMFYGASTISQGGRGAIGSLVSKMSSYVSLFGEGAIVFMNGCGDSLALELRGVGVTVLDCVGTVKLGRVLEHQKAWCASRDGQILN